MYKFLSPITIEENFLLKDCTQLFYVNDINDTLFNNIVICFYNYMQTLPPEGLKCYLHKTEMFYNSINYISISPILKNNKLYCQTNVYTVNNLNDIEKGILKDCLQDIFVEKVNVYMIIHDISYTPDKGYLITIEDALKEQRLEYTVKLNFFDYNKFYLEEVR